MFVKNHMEYVRMYYFTVWSYEDSKNYAEHVVSYYQFKYR